MEGLVVVYLGAHGLGVGVLKHIRMPAETEPKVPWLTMAFCESQL